MGLAQLESKGSLVLQLFPPQSLCLLPFWFLKDPSYADSSLKRFIRQVCGKAPIFYWQEEVQDITQGTYPLGMANGARPLIQKTGRE